MFPCHEFNPPNSSQPANKTTSSQYLFLLLNKFIAALLSISIQFVDCWCWCPFLSIVLSHFCISMLRFRLGFSVSTAELKNHQPRMHMNEILSLNCGFFRFRFWIFDDDDGFFLDTEFTGCFIVHIWIEIKRYIWIWI